MNTKVKTFKEYINERHLLKPFMRIDAEKKRRKQQKKKRKKKRRKTEKRNVGFRTHIAYIIIYT